MCLGILKCNCKPCSRKEHSKRMKEVYIWKTLKALKEEFGETLALDLKSRNTEADPRMTGKFVKPYLG